MLDIVVARDITGIDEEWNALSGRLTSRIEPIPWLFSLIVQNTVAEERSGPTLHRHRQQDH